MPITLNGTTGIVSPALDSDGSLTVGPAVMDAPTGSAPLFACRAWVNFDGTRDTTGAASTANTNRLIRGSGNVTSVLRNGTGDYTITFTTAMPDANYGYLCSGSTATRTPVIGANDTYRPTTTTLRVFAYPAGNTSPADATDVCVTIIR